MPKYRIYDAHKLVTSVLSDFSRFVAKADFTLDEVVEEIREKFSGIVQLIHGHAQHEDERIHPLLKQKASSVFEQTERDHEGHAAIFSDLNQLLTQTLASLDIETRLDFGRQFYLKFQTFEAHNLLHQIYEETVIMPELQRLYSDEELSELTEAQTFRKMTEEQIIPMFTALFPYYNPDDRRASLADLQRSTPEKFMAVWMALAPSVEADERERLAVLLDIPETVYQFAGG